MNPLPFRFVLHYQKGLDAWHEYPLNQSETILGRSADCHLSLRDEKASRHHVAIEIKNSEIWLKDLGSKNGTQVGGVRIEANVPRHLAPKETFAIGAYKFYITQLDISTEGVSQAAAPIRVPIQPVAPIQRPSKPKAKARPALGLIAALVGIGALLLCLCVAGYFLLPGFNVGSQATKVSQEAIATPKQAAGLPNPTSAQAEPTQSVEVQPEPTSMDAAKQTWLVMLYEDADDAVLEYDLFIDVNEAEKVGSTDRVKIVVQLDRYNAAFDGDGDWTTAKRFYLTQDDDMDQIKSEEVADLGEVDMADPNTLVDFVSWAASTYPADKYVLIISDHGGGWTGIAWDPDPPNPESELSDGMEINELDEALQKIQATTGVQKFELIGLDACLMGQLEVFAALAPYARYAVASEEVVPALGFAYSGFLGALEMNPAMSGADLAKAVVSTYIEQDQRVMDEKLRGRDWEGEVTTQEASDYEIAETTISAVDLTTFTELNIALGNLVTAMAKIDQGVVAAARTYTHPFYNIFTDLYPPSFIDLLHFAQMMQAKSDSAEVKQAADGLIAAVKQVIVAEKHGPGIPAANGIAIYFPNSGLYGTDDGGYDAYIANANRFAKDGIWDDFLSFHYTHTPVGSGVPQPGAQISAPGASGVTIAPVNISSKTVPIDGSVTLTSEVTGERIGYILMLVGYYEKETGLVLLADASFISSDSSKEIGGVYYPDWGEEGVVPLDVEWKPILWSISDGRDSKFALVQPEKYGASPEENLYSVKGIYTFSSGEQRYAKLFFGYDGILRQVIGFTGQGGTGAPREISPEPGDEFTILNQWVKWSKIKEGIIEFVEKEGGTLTFRDEDFTYEAVYAEPLTYYIGFMVEDLDGNRYGQFTTVTVTK